VAESEGSEVASGALRAWLLRVAPDVAVAALALQVWASLVAVPALFLGAFRGAGLGLALIPLGALAVGLALRSAPWLLLAFPTALLFPIGAEPRLVGGVLHGPVSFALFASALLAYLGGAAWITWSQEVPPAERTRRLASAGEPVAPRWRRRGRLYVALAVIAALFPMVLLWGVHFSPAHRAYLEKLYPRRAGWMTILLDVGVLVVWLGLFSSAILDPLRRHRTGDRDLLRRLERTRREARRGGARPVFYLAVIAALVLMGLLIAMRYR
jgi:hypothetical protein